MFLCAFTAFVVAPYVWFMRRVLPKKPQRIVIDTDIGDDIDDALAILLAVVLHKIGTVEIVAVLTAGAGNHQVRARLVRKLVMAVLGTCSVPIIAGRRNEGTSKGNYMSCGHYVYAERFPILGKPEKKWLRGILRDGHETGQQVLFLCIGPLDNLRYIDPPAGTFRLVLMGGCFGRFFDGQTAPDGFPEYNVAHGVDDWQCAIAKYHTNTLIVPLDIAGECRFDEWSRILTSCPYRAYRDMYRTWYNSPALQGSRILAGTNGGRLSSIQFDACALFVALYAEIADIQTHDVVVTDTGVTKKVTDGGRSFPVRVALGWKDQQARSRFDAEVLSLLQPKMI